MWCLGNSILPKRTASFSEKFTFQPLKSVTKRRKHEEKYSGKWLLWNLSVQTQQIQNDKMFRVTRHTHTHLHTHSKHALTTQHASLYCWIWVVLKKILLYFEIIVVFLVKVFDCLIQAHTKCFYYWNIWVRRCFSDYI